MNHLVACCFCAGERLSGFFIRVGNDFVESSLVPTTFAECWFQRDALGAGETRMFTCHSVTEGRFVTVHFPTENTTALAVCEVEVFADTGN